MRAVDVPVVTAGGVVDGRGLAAMLALGAEGVCMGRRFMATTECPVHENVKRWIVEAQTTDTVLVERSLRISMRVARTPAAVEVARMESRGESIESRRASTIEGQQTRAATLEGELATGLVCSGQTAGLASTTSRWCGSWWNAPWRRPRNGSDGCAPPSAGRCYPTGPGTGGADRLAAPRRQLCLPRYSAAVADWT